MHKEGTNRRGWFLQKSAIPFETLYAEYGKRVYRFCYRLSGNHDAAEDLTQDVFVAAYERLSAFQGRSAVITWLYRIAVYQWHTRRARRQPETTALEENMLPLSSTDATEARLNRLSLDAALSGLPEAWREAFILVKAEGLTCKEAAGVLEIPEGTVKFHIHQAVARLQSALDTQDKPDAYTTPAAPTKRGAK